MKLLGLIKLPEGKVSVLQNSNGSIEISINTLDLKTDEPSKGVSIFVNRMKVEKRKGGRMRSYKDSNYVIAIQMSTILKGTLIFIAGLLSVFSMVGILTSFNPEYRITSNSLNQAASSV